MTEFYLITGFLGAGKTTFLQHFLPKFKDRDIKLIINEFGNKGVDGSILQETGAKLQEICGGSIFCSCKLDKFEEAMNDCLLTTPDVIIVEASGLSDPTNIRKTLKQYEEKGKLIYKGCICLVDAVRFHKVFATARVCKKQLAVTDLVILNKIDLVTASEIETLDSTIKSQFPSIKTVKASFGKVDFKLEDLLVSRSHAFDSETEKPDITLQKTMLSIDPSMSLYELERFLNSFAEDTARIKGYVTLADHGFVLVDCVGSMVNVKVIDYKEVEEGLNLLATAGQPMRKALKTAMTYYNGKVAIVK
ncbi:MAG: GTP-binding protein [Clostridia bacterium]